MDSLETRSPLEGIDGASRAYARFYETLAPDGIDALDAMVRADILFRDPFQEFRGRDRFKALFARMYATVDRPRFDVSARALDGRLCFLRWTFRGALRGRNFAVDGVSEVGFDAAGLVETHIDHWDAASQFYEHVPVLGGALRLLKRRMRH